MSARRPRSLKWSLVLRIAVVQCAMLTLIILVIFGAMLATGLIPHDYEDGTMDVLAEHKFDPGRCVMDHNTEETVREVLERGFFAGFSIYPHTKMGNERLTEIVRHYGPERIIADSACDWGGI